HGLLHALIGQGLVDRAYIDAHTEGFEALKALVRDWTPARAAQGCGLRVADICQAAEWFGRAPASLSLSGEGRDPRSHGRARAG
ncbi:hypothetical protein ABTK76_19745, partial [Acinetobacter baumannii]